MPTSATLSSGTSPTARAAGPRLPSTARWWPCSPTGGATAPDGVWDRILANLDEPATTRSGATDPRRADHPLRAAHVSRRPPRRRRSHRTPLVRDRRRRDGRSRSGRASARLSADLAAVKDARRGGAGRPRPRRSHRPAGELTAAPSARRDPAVVTAEGEGYLFGHDQPALEARRLPTLGRDGRLGGLARRARRRARRGPRSGWSGHGVPRRDRRGRTRFAQSDNNPVVAGHLA